MKRKPLIVFFIIFAIVVSPIGYTLYHDSSGKDAAVHIHTEKISIPFSQDLHTITILFNDFTYWKVALKPTANIVIDGKSIPFNAFDSFSLPPTRNFSNPERLSTWQYAHGMVITIPPNLINTLLNAKDVKLSVQYSNGNRRDISLNSQLSLSKKQST